MALTQKDLMENNRSVLCGICGCDIAKAKRMKWRLTLIVPITLQRVMITEIIAHETCASRNKYFECIWYNVASSDAPPAYYGNMLM